MSTARSLTEVVKLKGKVTNLLLSASRDLVCTNLWCEHVTGPCVCRLGTYVRALPCHGVLFMRPLSQLE